MAVAIATGGPGAVFWMWVSAFLGIATKFFTCTLSIMYRGYDSEGKLQGGTMYMVMEGLGKKWKPLAVLFSIAGLFGALPIFQANQLTQILRDVIYIPNGWVTQEAHFTGDLITGLVIFGIVSLVIFGGIKRIGRVASKLVPAMVVLYVGSALAILFAHYDVIPQYLYLIVTDAFTAQAAMGGALGQLIVTGFKRAAFSNEAGIGTATLAHGAAKTKEPIREGLVAMLGPAIDTLLVCTMTALVILVSGAWQSGNENGIILTASAFQEALGDLGPYLLVLCVSVFAFSSLFTYSYYGTKCMGFLIGAEKQHYYNYFYVVSIVMGAVTTLSSVINLIDGMFALMAIPTVVTSLILAPKVIDAAKDYFSRIDTFEVFK
ncbi:MAG: alanine/glycine:cation symporter family protein [Balneolaceae bacterium]|nr:alanine/glycine:cation symporter family protein [Balneolaceae bacterium]